MKTCTVHCLSLTSFFILSLYRKRLDFSLSHTFFFILSLYRKKLDFSLSHTFFFLLSLYRKRLDFSITTDSLFPFYCHPSIQLGILVPALRNMEQVSWIVMMFYNVTFAYVVFTIPRISGPREIPPSSHKPRTLAVDNKVLYKMNLSEEFKM